MLAGHVHVSCLAVGKHFASACWPLPLSCHASGSGHDHVSCHAVGKHLASACLPLLIEVAMHLAQLSDFLVELCQTGHFGDSSVVSPPSHPCCGGPVSLPMAGVAAIVSEAKLLVPVLAPGTPPLLCSALASQRKDLCMMKLGHRWRQKKDDT